MKTIFVIFLASILANTAFAEDWCVLGRDYHNVKVGTVDADKVHVTYDGGIGAIPLANLPPDLQKRFNYDPAKAKSAAIAESEARDKAIADSQAEAKERQAEQPVEAPAPVVAPTSVTVTRVTLPPPVPQCPPSLRPGWHQKSDGAWVQN